VVLAWTDNITDAQSLWIWRQSGHSAWIFVAFTPPLTTTYTDTSLAPGTTYTYRMQATGETGASGWSNEATAVTVAASPAAPTHLTATAPSPSQVDLTWTSHSDNETAFAIWRATGDGAFVRVGVVAPHTTRFSDTGLTPNTTYTYEVRATNNIGASAWSNPATAATP
jgi:fibronectin type 3 domain-containing protein